MNKTKEIIKALNNAGDTEELTKYENKLICILMGRFFLVIAIIWYIIVFFIEPSAKVFNIFSASVFLISSILLFILFVSNLKAFVVSIFIEVIFSGLTLYLFFNLYDVVSYLIWIILIGQMIFAMFKIKKWPSIIVGSTYLLTIVVVFINFEKYNVKPGLFFFIMLIVSIIVIGIILYSLNRVNRERYFKLQNKLRVEKEQKEEITALYEEITASEEELRQKNEQLVDYTQELVVGQKKLNIMAYYDSLTGLPNRKMILETIEKQIEYSKLNSTKFYVVYIDVDAFKKVNDTMGHHVGDDFLVFVAKNLKNLINKKDLLGRLGGDEFALIIRRDIEKEEVKAEVEKIKKVFQIPFIIRNIEVILTASFGISVYPIDGINVGKLLKNADMSMYKAKELGKNQIRFFDKEMLDAFLKETRMENLLSKAMENREFHLVFQPQYDANAKKIRGFEALLRWNSKELGMVSPIKFIPIAEETRLIIPLGNWVLKEACEKYKEFKKIYPEDFIMSVNISMIQLNEENFTKDVIRILKETNMKPSDLEIEITESEATEKIENITHKLNKLKDLGVRVALDDFGTGYSSLSHLKRLPIDILKIDKSFIDDINEEMEGVHIVKDIISLVHNLRIKIVVEGIEQSGQLNVLKKYGCDFVQGFLLSLPLDEKEVYEFLNNNKTRKKI